MFRLFHYEACMVDKRAIGILLECFLAYFMILFTLALYYFFDKNLFEMDVAEYLFHSILLGDLYDLKFVHKTTICPIYNTSLF